MTTADTRRIEHGLCCAVRPGDTEPGERASFFTPEAACCALLSGDAAGGMRGGVLAGLAESLFNAAFSHGSGVRQAVETAVTLLPAQGAPTLLALRLGEKGALYIARTGLPAPVFLHRGKARPLPWRARMLGMHRLWECEATLALRDTIVCMGGGIALAGRAAAQSDAFGAAVSGAAAWCDQLLPGYLEAAYTPSVAAEKLAQLAVGASRGICSGVPAFDLNAAVVRYWGRAG